MSRYRYTETEKEINAVLNKQSEDLKSISFQEIEKADQNISSSEALLKELGYDIPEPGKKDIKTPDEQAVIAVSSWDEMVNEAKDYLEGECDLEALFTEDELRENSDAVKKLAGEYRSLNRLDKYDIAISAAAALTGALIDILLIGIPKKNSGGLKGAALSNYIRDHFDRKFPPGEMEKLANSKISKVPYDAQDNRNTNVRVEGMSAYYHRLLSLGHDPLLGFFVGVSDILNGKMTTIDKDGKAVSQVMGNYSDRRETDIFAAIAKQINHFKSDVTTSMGLPAPLMGLFDLLQFGSIGEEDQTIAQIVQGMYFEGYDFIHFCTLSIPVMVTEVIVRIGYAVKRIKEGSDIKEAIPVSNKDNAKLTNMLFTAHAGAAAINAGKIIFTQNPMAINYSQWLAFAGYSYRQLKRLLLEKPVACEVYITGKIDGELSEILCDTEKLFDDMTRDFTVVFD